MVDYSRVARVAWYLAAIETLSLPAANDNVRHLSHAFPEDSIPPTPDRMIPDGSREAIYETSWIIRSLELLLAAAIILFFL